MVINFQGLDKYKIKYTGIKTNIRAKIGQTYKQTRTDGQTDGKNIRNYTFK